MTIIMITKKTIASQIQIDKPSTRTGPRFFWTTGLGNSAWQRQHTFLSSGFQVPHFRQSGIWGPLYTAKSWHAGRQAVESVLTVASYHSINSLLKVSSRERDIAFTRIRDYLV
jgi:hypothetical protein